MQNASKSFLDEDFFTTQVSQHLAASL